MKLNFITDHGSILDRMSCAFRVDCGAFGAMLAAAVFGGLAGLAGPDSGLAWTGAVTLAVIGLDDLSPLAGRAGLAEPVLDRTRKEGILTPEPSASGS
jgi:hypothetical protein